MSIELAAGDAAREHFLGKVPSDRVATILGGTSASEGSLWGCGKHRASVSRSILSTRNGNQTSWHWRSWCVLVPSLGGSGLQAKGIERTFEAARRLALAALAEAEGVDLPEGDS